MKRPLTIILIILLICFTAKAQHLNDPALQDYIRLWAPTMINKKGDIDRPERFSKYMYINDKGIKDLGGIEFFTQLIHLDVSDNHNILITKLPNGLRRFVGKRCGLTSLPELPPMLTKLDITNNSISELKALPASLQILNCDSNSIASLPGLPGGLQELYCSHNPINSLPSLPSSLLILDCSHSNIHDLPPLPNDLYTLNVSGDTINDFPTLPVSLRELIVDKNTYIKCLPNWPDYLKTKSSDYSFVAVNPPKCNDQVNKTARPINTNDDPANLNLVVKNFAINTTNINTSSFNNGFHFKDSFAVVLPAKAVLWVKFWYADVKQNGQFYFTDADPKNKQLIGKIKTSDDAANKSWGGYAYISPGPSQRTVYLNFCAGDNGADCYAEYYIYPEAFSNLSAGTDFITRFKFVYSQNLSQFNLLPEIDTLNVFNRNEKSSRQGNKYTAVLKSGLTAAEAAASYRSYQQLIEAACTDPRYIIAKVQGKAQSFFPNLKTETDIYGLKEMGGSNMEHCYMSIEKDGENTFKIMMEFESTL